MAKAVNPSWAYSFAHFVNGQLRLDMLLPNLPEGTSEGARVQIRNGKTTRTAPATIAANDLGPHLEAIFPASTLRNGAWSVAISRRSRAGFEDTGARLVVAAPNPISLLVGGPAPESDTPKPVHTAKRRRRILRTLGAAADRVLVELPPKTATRVRGVLRSGARKAVSVVPN